MNLLQNTHGMTTTTKEHNITSMKNVRKLTDVFRDTFVAAEDEDDIDNLLTMEVMTETCIIKTYWNETRLDNAC